MNFKIGDQVRARHCGSCGIGASRVTPSADPDNLLLNRTKGVITGVQGRGVYVVRFEGIGYAVSCSDCFLEPDNPFAKKPTKIIAMEIK